MITSFIPVTSVFDSGEDQFDFEGLSHGCATKSNVLKVIMNVVEMIMFSDLYVGKEELYCKY